MEHENNNDSSRNRFTSSSSSSSSYGKRKYEVKSGDLEGYTREQLKLIIIRSKTPRKYLDKYAGVTKRWNEILDFTVAFHAVFWLNVLSYLGPLHDIWGILLASKSVFKLWFNSKNVLITLKVNQDNYKTYPMICKRFQTALGFVKSPTKYIKGILIIDKEDTLYQTGDKSMLDFLKYCNYMWFRTIITNSSDTSALWKRMLGEGIVTLPKYIVCRNGDVFYSTLSKKDFMGMGLSENVAKEFSESDRWCFSKDRQFLKVHNLDLVQEKKNWNAFLNADRLKDNRIAWNKFKKKVNDRLHEKHFYKKVGKFNQKNFEDCSRFKYIKKTFTFNNT